MTTLHEAAQQVLEACPFCGNEPSFSGDASEWKDDGRYVELSLGCCALMTEQIGWRRAREMTHEAKTAELRSRLQLRWNTRAAPPQQPEPVEPVAQVHPNHLKPTDDGKPWCREVLLYSGDHNGDLFKGENYRVKLYAAPPQRPPLTEEEIEFCRQQGYAHAGLRSPFDFGKAARAVERAHGIKE